MSDIKFYQLPLETSMDRDIIDRLDAIPRSRKAEWVRTAIRVYMGMENGQQTILPHVAYKENLPTQTVTEEQKKLPKFTDEFEDE
jgi:hypothetical protein